MSTIIGKALILGGGLSNSQTEYNLTGTNGTFKDDIEGNTITKAKEGDTVYICSPSPNGPNYLIIILKDSENNDISYTYVTAVRQTYIYDIYYSFVMPASDVTLSVTFAGSGN